MHVIHDLFFHDQFIFETGVKVVRCLGFCSTKEVMIGLKHNPSTSRCKATLGSKIPNCQGLHVESC